MSLHPSTTTSLASHLGDDAPGCIDAAIAKLEHDLRPVPAAGADRAEWAAAIDERLRRLAVKVLPTAKSADTIEWRKTMAEALADLPAMVALTAAKRAIHRPFRFMGDIEPAVREIALEVQAERDERLAAFRRHRAEIESALNPPTALPAPGYDEPISAQGIRAMKPEWRQLGVKLGHVTQAEVDAALRGEEQLAA